jgi:DNA-binding transcriptional MerR regulator
MTVGELAKRTGVSVRALHHYEAIGLLAPVRRTEAGYRLYGDEEIIRLQQIRSLRQLGFALDEIRECLDRRAFSPLLVVERHLARGAEQIAAERRLYARLERLAAGLRAPDAVSVDEFLTTIEEMTRVEKYYTAEQLEEIKARGRRLGEEAIGRAEREWQALIDEVRAEMADGTDPSSERVRTLAARWKGLVEAFTGGDPEIMRSLQTMWQQEEAIHGVNTGEMRVLAHYVFSGASGG